MAAAALAGPAVQQATHKAADAIHEFAEDPVLNTCDLLVKVGAVFAISGAFLYAVAKATVRPEQQFLNDANDRLGLPPSTSPTPPKVPPTAAPPPYAVEFQAIINDLLGISQVSSADATKTLLDAQQHANNLFAILNGAVTTVGPAPGPEGTTPGVCGSIETQVVNANGVYMCVLTSKLSDYTSNGWTVSTAQGPAGSPTTSYTLTPPPGVNNDLNYLIEILGNAANLMSGLTADGKSKNPAGVDWASTKTYVTSAANTMIALGNDLALPAPFVFASVDATTPPQSNNSFWEIFSGPGAAAFSSIQDAGAAALGAVENAVGTAFNDVSQFAGDVGQAVAFIGKAMMNFPFLFGDAIGYAVSWGANTLATDLWPFLLGLGLLFMAAGLVGKFVYLNFWPKLENRLKLGATARMDGLWNRFDRWYKTRGKVGEVWTQKGTEAMIEAAAQEPVYTRSTTVLPSVKVDLEGTRIRTRILKPGSEAGLVKEETKDFGEGAASDSNTPAENSHEKGGGKGPKPEKPIPGGATTAETEDLLGGHHAAEPTAEELRAQEAARKASMPPQAVEPEGPAGEPEYSSEQWAAMTPEQKEDAFANHSSRVPAEGWKARSEGITFDSATSPPEPDKGEPGVNPAAEAQAPPPPVVNVTVQAAPRRQKPHDRREPTAEQLMAMATRSGAEEVYAQETDAIKQTKAARDAEIARVKAAAKVEEKAARARRRAAKTAVVYHEDHAERKGRKTHSGAIQGMDSEYFTPSSGNYG